MKWIVIFFLANDLEHVYGEVEICDYAKINEQVEIFETETKKNVEGWGCYDEKTFLLRQDARKRLGIDV
jgi:hypothetical protein|tara:strand:+ start:5858 stop:6064 length:207 start_codon:yes stop_codon:yes gene_type:complete